MNSTTSPQSTDSLLSWQREFIEFAIKKQVLQFGDFTLKSGRKSPYFFNAGNFNDGESQQMLGEIYAKTLMESKISFDLVFGPAYKGIPLATSTVYSLNKDHQHNTSFAFNRKEAKNHGEGGQLIGATLEGNIVLVDDVITAGTAIRETLSLLENYPKAKLVAAVVLIDRQEKMNDSSMSAIQSLESEYGLSILPVITLNQIMGFLTKDVELEKYLPMMNNYRQQYGAG